MHAQCVYALALIEWIYLTLPWLHSQLEPGSLKLQPLLCDLI